MDCAGEETMAWDLARSTSARPPETRDPVSVVDGSACRGSDKERVIELPPGWSNEDEDEDCC